MGADAACGLSNGGFDRSARIRGAGKCVRIVRIARRGQSQPFEHFPDKIERARHGDEGFASDRPKGFIDARTRSDGPPAMSLLKRLAELVGLTVRGLETGATTNREAAGAKWVAISRQALSRSMPNTITG